MSSAVDSRIVIVLTTLGADADAAALAKTLIEERLVACVNIMPMTTVYCWKGKIEHNPEQQLFIKTTAARVEELETRLLQLHRYEVPEFLVVRVDASTEIYRPSTIAFPPCRSKNPRARAM